MTRGIVRWLVSFRYLAAFAALLIAACGDNPRPLPDASPVTLSRIDLTPVNPQLPLGIAQQLTATGVFSDGTTQNVSSRAAWSSSSAANVTVSAIGLASAVARGNATITAILDGVSGTTTVTATDAVLDTVMVTPVNPSVPAGLTRPLIATAIFSDKTNIDVTDQATWSSSSATAATVSNEAGKRGVATGVAKGTAMISAALGGKTGSTTLTVSDAVLQSIGIDPPLKSVAAGLKQQFEATGTFSDNSKQNLTTQVTWTSSDTAVATISSDGDTRGEATTLVKGATTITAALMGVNGTAALTVTDAALVSIDVEPKDAKLPLGLKESFKATGTFTDSSTQNLTTQVTWTSSDPAVAQISNADDEHGVATSVAKGTTTISAKLGDIDVTGSTSLEVVDAALTAIEISPVTPKLPVGLTQQFTATGTFTAGEPRNLTDQVTWTSSVPTVAQISNAEGEHGLATGLTKGTTTIKAELMGIHKEVELEVTDAVVTKIEVSPASPSVPAGKTQAFIATATLSDTNTRNVTDEVTWAVDKPDVAQISNGDETHGVATGLTPGTTDVTATLGDIVGHATLEVTDAVVTAIAVTPDDAQLPIGRTQQFTAIATLSDTHTRNVTNEATWESTDPAIARISNGEETHGEATGVSKGTVMITAKLDDVTGSAPLEVVDAALTAIVVTPTEASIVVEGTQPFTAMGMFSDGHPRDVTAEVTWSSSNSEVAAISNADEDKGVATGIAAGDTEITAKLQDVTSNAAALQVTEAQLQSITIDQAHVAVARFGERSITATGHFNDGHSRDVTGTVTWSSSNEDVLQISNADEQHGLASGRTVGTVDITAAQGEITATTTLSVIDFTQVFFAHHFCDTQSGAPGSSPIGLLHPVDADRFSKVQWFDAEGHAFSIDATISFNGFEGLRCVPDNELAQDARMSVVFVGARGNTTATFTAHWNEPQSLIEVGDLDLVITP